MDAYDAGSMDGNLVEESQASQLIHDLLDPGIGFNRSSAVTSNSHLNVSSNISDDNNISESIHSSRHSDMETHYHFHGLAATQTQSENIPDGDEANESSQKENIRASGDGTKTTIPLMPLPHASSTRNMGVRQPHVPLSHSSPRVAKTNIKLSAGASSKSPLRVSEPAISRRRASPRSGRRSARNAPQQRSRSSSQDSFAESPSRDPQQEFIANTKQFEIPLSELGRFLRSGDDSVDATASQPPSDMFTRPRAAAPPINFGRILVESTPSNSASSQSQSQSQSQLQPNSYPQLAESQPSQEIALAQRQPEPEDDQIYVDTDSQGYESSEPSSSYGRLLNGEPDPNGGEPELEPTQPSTQVNEIDEEEEEIANVNDLFSRKMVPPNDMQSTVQRSTSSRPLAPKPLVDQLKPWRFKGLVEKGFISSTKSSNGSVAYREANVLETQPALSRNGIPPRDYVEPLHIAGPISASDADSAWQETQPMEQGEISELPQGEILFPNRFLTKERLVTNNDDTMDVVPDSEPLRDITALKEKTDTLIGKVQMTDNAVTLMSKHEEDEEDDVPLALASNAKGKMKAPIQDSTSHPSQDEGSSQKQNKGHPKQVPGGRALGVAEVPSSLPEQDEPPVKGGKSKINAIKHGKSNARKGKTANRAVLHQDEKSSHNFEYESSPNATEAGTEPSDENDYSDGDLYAPGPSGRKRKRSNGTTTPNRPRKKTSNVNHMSATHLLRSSYATPSSTNETRIFALWARNQYYYPAQIYAVRDKQYYSIVYDDGDKDIVAVDQMRRFELRIHDEVLVGKSKKKYTVIGVDRIAKGKIKVSSMVGQNLKEEECDIKTIRIAPGIIQKDWDDRKVSASSITVDEPSKVRLSPSPSRLSMVTASSAKGTQTQRDTFSNTAFVVTGVDDTRVKRMKKDISSNGGILVEMTDVICMHGTHSNSNCRWVINKEEIKWMGDAKIRHFFVLAEKACATSKFLIALALGVPCLSIDWLYDSIEKGSQQNWPAYLLPQGESDVLKACLSQQVDLNWCDRVDHLTDIKSNRVPSKPFLSMSVLCVGLDMMPQPGKKTLRHLNQTGQEIVNSFTRIILSMGSDRVEAVTEARYATQKPTEYDLVVVKLDGQFSKSLAGARIVSWAWVKNCLISSRLLPWPEDSDSQLKCSQEV